jgi:hypothetical protein
MTEPLRGILGSNGRSQILTKGTFPGTPGDAGGWLPFFALTNAGNHIVLSPEQGAQLALQIGHWLALLNDELN